jgi:hypothetical protein
MGLHLAIAWIASVLLSFKWVATLSALLSMGTLQTHRPTVSSSTDELTVATTARLTARESPDADWRLCPPETLGLPKG